MTERFLSLDLLRGIAAFTVAISHFLATKGIKTNYAEMLAIIAVEVFFVLSGYVLAQQIILVLNRPSKLPVFLARRWMRTIPAFLVALTLVAVALRQLGSGDYWRTAFYIQNFYQQHNTSDFYSVAWSLSVEEWFYVIFPLWMLACTRFAALTPRTLAASTVSFIIAITIVRLLFGPEAAWGSNVRRVVVFRVDAIAWGFLLYNLHLTARKWHLYGIPLFAGAMALSLALIESPLAQFAFPFFAAAFGMASVMGILTTEATCRRPNLMPGVKWIGQVSYSVYLFHPLSIYATITLLGGHSSMVQLLAFVALTALTATATGHFIEEPILRRRPSYGPEADSTHGQSRSNVWAHRSGPQ